MKKDTIRKTQIFFCLVLSFCLLIGLSQGKALASKMERYENNVLGFSIQYDTKRLSRDLPLKPGLIFHKGSTQGRHELSILSHVFPPRVRLSNAAQFITYILRARTPRITIHEVYNHALLKLTRHIKASFFQMKWNDGKQELVSAILVAKKDGRAIIVSLMDSPQNSVENLANTVKSLKFDVEIDQNALNAEGVIERNTFTRRSSPAFALKYPTVFKKMPLLGIQLLRVGVPNGTPTMDITLYPMNSDQKIDEQLKAYADLFAKNFSAVGSDVKIVSNEMIRTRSKFPTSQVVIKWKWAKTYPLTSVVHLIAKENTVIVLAGHTGTHNLKQLQDIFSGIDLDP